MSTTWESIEERERRVRGSRTTSTMARAAEQIPAGKSLQEAFAQRQFISREDVRAIGSATYDNPVVSLYLNFSPERLVRADRPVYLSIFSSLRHQALEKRKAYIDGLPHTQRLRVLEDLREVQEFLETFEPAGARALVIFKSGEQLNRVMPLPVRVADSLTLETDGYVEPLEAILEEQHRILVLDVAQDRTDISIDEFGYEQRLDSVTEDLPRETHEAFREGIVERHRLVHVKWQFKAAAQLADRLARERGADLVVLIGKDTVIQEFDDYLPKALRDRVVARLQLPPDANANRRRTALDQVLAEQRAKDEEAAIGELGFYQGHGRLAVGLETVINAMDLFLTRQLVVRDDLAAPGFVCRNHHFMSLKAGSCPFDNQPLEDAENVVDELIEMSRLHGVDVVLVSQRREQLDPYRGIAAVLVTTVPPEELRAVSVGS